MPFSKKIIFFYFFLLPAILYAGIITHFTFDFFGYDYLWQAYNALALSIMDGRLNVPYEAIGRESLYYNGKVYFYYGYFPVLLRIIVSPFVDLNTVPLARLSVWLMTTAGASALQYALIFYSRPKNITASWNLISIIKLILLSLIIWFGSAYFIIIQKGMIYNEPYAAMLMLSSVFLVLVYKDIFWDFKSRRYRLVLYALLAALCVHTRQTVAVSLYMGVIILIIMMTIDTVKFSTNKIQNNKLKLFLYEFIKNGYKPLLVLFLGGAVLLLLNYIRFDDLFAMTKGQYGYQRLGEISARVCGGYITGAGRFEIARIIPNLIYYTLGGIYTHGRLIDYLGLGYVRIEYGGIRFIWLWSSILIVFLLVIWALIQDLITARSAKTILALSLIMTFIVSSLIILSYTTITIRYMADLWLPLGFTLLIFSQKWLFENKPRKNYLLYIMLVSITVNVSYSAYVYSKHKTWELSKTKNKLPSKKMVEKLYNPPSRLSKEEKLEACKKYNFNK